MADKGHELTDEILSSLQDRIAEEFADALQSAEEKLQKYLDAFNAEDEIQKQRMADGEITKEQYNAWAIRRKLNGKHWEEMRDALAADFHHATKMAIDIAEGRMPDVYALNHNFGVYEIESGGGIYTGMTLYNHDTAEYLLTQQRQLMPGPSTAKAKKIAENKDMQWNKQKIQSNVLQGVLLGDGPAATAKRLVTVAKMDYNAAVRYARTMTTSAQNAGRYESYRRAKELGVQLTIEWQATLDSHTRHDHRMMHGQRTEVDKPFHTPDGFTILYPADCSGVSTAPQGQIWNCRCTLRPWVKGHEGKTVTESPGMEGMSFEEWQDAGKRSGRIQFTSPESNGIIDQRGIADRNMSNGLRQSPFHTLTVTEIKNLKADAESIGVPLELLSFNTGSRTGYSDRSGIIHVRGDVLPDLNSTYARDRLSSRAVLAHEYYGHYMTRGTDLIPGDWRDEFRASYRAAKYTPNLTDEERQLLIQDAMDRAKGAGINIRVNGFMRKMLYGAY